MGYARQLERKINHAQGIYADKYVDNTPKYNWKIYFRCPMSDAIHVINFKDVTIEAVKSLMSRQIVLKIAKIPDKKFKKTVGVVEARRAKKRQYKAYKAEQDALEQEEFIKRQTALPELVNSLDRKKLTDGTLAQCLEVLGLICEDLGFDEPKIRNAVLSREIVEH